MSHPRTRYSTSEMRGTLPEFGRFSQMQIYMYWGTAFRRTEQPDGAEEELNRRVHGVPCAVGQGKCASRAEQDEDLRERERAPLVRHHRTRHRSETVSDPQGNIRRTDHRTGSFSGRRGVSSAPRPAGDPTGGGNTLRCDFLFNEHFNSYFPVFNWREGPQEIQFRLKKASRNGSGRRRKLV